MKKITLKAIAERAGVSVATVSRALNGRGQVDKATREQILRIAEELGYAPDMAARSLVLR
ncbi:LacI family DNA-binding transcriptional regulator, partial [Thermoflexus sp.]|uniref:LacI family DNA-binding transcriptional regulator n=1 Tax=Thermoflexus sp. TaxID=1969742 RepID=UPI00345D3653